MLRPPPLADLATALVLVVVCQAEMWLYDGGPRGAAAVTVVATVVLPTVLALRRTAPQVAAGLASLTMAGQTLLGGWMTGTLGIAITGMLLIFSTGAHLPRARAAVWAGAFLAATWLDLAMTSHGVEYGLLSDFVFTGLLIVGGPFMAGSALRSLRERSAELERLNALLAEQADLLADAAIVDERARIAREMHDVVSHSVSLMVVQAGAARHLLERDPAQSRQALFAVEEVGREALHELRRVLGVLREEGVTSSLAPQPGTQQIPELVERARSTGLDVEYDVHGEPRDLAPGAGLAAYRVVQEALTNATRYANGSRTRVRVSWDDAAVHVSVSDDGGVAVIRHAGGGGGHGLAGMRERVAAYGGTLRAGRIRDGRGFEVHARLPLHSAEESA